jgi:AcrR family transcriptional regulator
VNGERSVNEQNGVDVEHGEPVRRRLTRAQTKARTREQLLRAAARVFARKGFAGASVEEIAESAGYSIGALYSNFHSKEQLFLELLTARTRPGGAYSDEVIAAVGDGAADPVAALSRLLAAVADADTDFMALQAEFWLYAVRNPVAMEAFAGWQREQAAAMESLVAAALRSCDVTGDVPVEAVTTLVFGLFQGLVRQRRVDRDTVPEELFAQGLRWLFAGLRSD